MCFAGVWVVCAESHHPSIPILFIRYVPYSTLLYTMVPNTQQSMYGGVCASKFTGSWVGRMIPICRPPLFFPCPDRPPIPCALRTYLCLGSTALTNVYELANSLTHAPLLLENQQLSKKEVNET